MARICGIDLGTTNSLIGVLEDGRPELVRDETGSALLPSVVDLGAGAIIRSAKRFMGRAPADLTEAEKRRYRFADDEKGTVVRFAGPDRDYSAPEVSAKILTELKGRLEAKVGEGVTHAVITVPAYFNDAQRQATRDAGRLAGLDVLRLVNEPTAACLAYGLDDLAEGNVVVFDFGGGTFDVSALHVHDKLFEVLATAGVTQLGGDDLDRAIAESLLGLDSNSSAEQTEVLLSTAKGLKHALTETESVTIPMPGGAEERTFTRSQVDEVIAPIVDRTLEPCRRVLADANLTNADINAVVLVGGSTRIPIVRRRVAEFFESEPLCELNPDEVVAMGATIQAGILSGARSDMLLLDVVPLSLGIETVGGVVAKLVDRNTRIPASVREQFTTSVDNQTHVDIHVLQGERELVSDCRSLARFRVPIEPAPAGFPRLQVTLLIDANGILSVTGTDERTGAASSIEVKPSYGLTDDEVERMLEESLDFAEEDFFQRQLIEARTEADVMLRTTRKALRDHHRKMSDELRDAIEAAVDALELSVREEDYKDIRDKIEALNDSSLPLAETLMNASIKSALETRTVDEIVSDATGS